MPRWPVVWAWSRYIPDGSHLSPDLRAIERIDVLERRNPLFEGITTGVVVGDEFFYMANVQDDKQGGFDPIAVKASAPLTQRTTQPGAAGSQGFG